MRIKFYQDKPIGNSMPITVGVYWQVLTSFLVHITSLKPLMLWLRLWKTV